MTKTPAHGEENSGAEHGGQPLGPAMMHRPATTDQPATAPQSATASRPVAPPPTTGLTDTPPRLVAAPVISYADRFSFLPMVTAAAAGLHTSVHIIGMAVTAYFMMYGLAQPFVGALSDRVGRVPVLRASLWVLAGADLVAALAPTPWTLLVSRAVAGAASGALLPTTLVYLGDTVDFRLRQRAVARVLAAASLSAGVAMAVAGWLAHTLTWRVPLQLIAVAALLAAAGLRHLPAPPPVAVAARARFRAVLTARPAVLTLIVFALLEGAAMLGFFTFFAPMLTAAGHSSTSAGLVVGVYGVAAVIGARLLHALPSRLVPALPLIGGGSLLIGGYTVVAVGHGLTPVLIASTLLGAAFSLFHSTFQTMATDLLPQARGIVTSLFVASVFTGAALASAWGASFASRGDYQGLFSAAAGLSVAVALAGTGLRLRYRADGA